MMSGTAKRLGAIAIFVVAGVPACGGGAAQSTGDAGSNGPVDSALDAPIAEDAIPVDARLPADAQPVDAQPVDAQLLADAQLPMDAQLPVDAQLVPDAPPDAPAPQEPRLIAPLSMTAVTQQRPTLRWTLPDDLTAPVVDLCRDRACATPLLITVDMADSGRSAVPRTALPTGWVYWRVRSISGARTVSSATWQFWVGRSSASNLVDTSNGALLDINGDGFADLVVGAPLSFNQFGAVFVYFGSATASATDWTGASAPARIQLVAPGGGEFGSVVASVGDINGDGYADFVAGAVGGGATGRVRLYLGSASPSAASWTGPNATQRIDLAGPVPDSPGFGRSVAGVGDVNGDGYGDFVIGGGGGGGGGAHIYFGSAVPSRADWDAAISPHRIDFINPGFGTSYGGAVAGPGDVNGDGYADILIGTLSRPDNNDDEGKAYIYLGSAAPSFPAWYTPSSTRRIALSTPDGFNRGFGATLAGAGDVNGDGYADFLISAEFADAGDPTSATGRAHLYLGSAAPTADGWSGATAGERIDLVSPDGVQSAFGSAVSGAGDVNGDGFTDFVVTAFQTGQARGAAHVYLGGATPDPARWNSIGHPSRLDLFNPDGPGARFGGSAAGVGDVNGDGFDDFLVGTFSDAFLSSATGGAAHVYLGLTNPITGSWNGVMPASRIDIPNPGGQISGFGNSVALVGPRPARAARRHK